MPDRQLEPEDRALRLRGVDERTLAVSGEIDDLSADEFAAALAAEWVRDVDMSGVTFFNSCGVRALLGARCHRQELRVVAPSRTVARVLELLGLSSIVAACDDPRSPG